VLKDQPSIKRANWRSATLFVFAKSHLQIVRGIDMHKWAVT